MSEEFEQELSVKSCLQRCLEISRNHVQTLNGAKEVLKNLNRDVDMELVVLTKDLLEGYYKLILKTCETKGIPTLIIESRKELGEIMPLKKVKKIGAVAIKDFVYESREKGFIMKRLK